MNLVEDLPAAAENKQHVYRSNEIPWYVRFYWVIFWCFVAYYSVTYLIPDLQHELLTPP